MYLLLYYAAIGIVKREKGKNERDNVLVIPCSHRYCKKRKKGENERDNVLVILLCSPWGREAAGVYKKGNSD